MTVEKMKAHFKVLLGQGRTDAVISALPLAMKRYPEEQVFQDLFDTLCRTSPVDDAAPPKSHHELALAAFPGQDYTEWLKWMHAELRPRTYLEIGVETGRTLQFASAQTTAIGIDPQPQICYALGEHAKVFALESDVFFDTYDAKAELGNAIDFAFIDGLHTFDQALKDLVNVERNGHGGTVAVFHDTFPVAPETALRNRETVFWVGDTWKVVHLLRAARPDLKIFTIPTYPSGLTVVTGLDPRSTILADRLHSLIDAWMPVRLEDHLQGLPDTLNVIANTAQAVRKQLGLGTGAENRSALAPSNG